ncbi:MAG TPA: alpha/beta fold hydrolase [Thermoanaerobaculia bacterium]|nr:alpha/beta fold hydrolase [Thermoanaerobaculia bacterium]
MITRDFEARDAARNRTFPATVWQPEGDGPFPLIVYSHGAAQHRKNATFLTSFLAENGYRVAALDHSEVVAPELRRPSSETEEQKQRRWRAVIDSRVPDIRFLLDQLGAGDRVGIVGHSFGAWTALAAPDVEPRIAAIVALAAGGTKDPRPGILPVTLDFRWNREIPTLVVGAENDTSLPIEGMFETFERIPSKQKTLAVLHRADHMHFVDEIEKLHEAFRTANMGPELAAIQREMLPMSELTSEEEAHRFVREIVLAHFNQHLLQM